MRLENQMLLLLLLGSVVLSDNTPTAHAFASEETEVRCRQDGKLYGKENKTTCFVPTELALLRPQRCVCESVVTLDKAICQAYYTTFGQGHAPATTEFTNTLYGGVDRLLYHLSAHSSMILPDVPLGFYQLTIIPRVRDAILQPNRQQQSIGWSLAEPNKLKLQTADDECVNGDGIDPAKEIALRTLHDRDGFVMRAVLDNFLFGLGKACP